LIGKSHKYPERILEKAKLQAEQDLEYDKENIPYDERPPRYWCKVKDLKLKS
jgi:hypothetical protein